MLLIEHPAGRDSERAYIYSTLLTDFLGLPATLRPTTRPDVRISRADRPDGRELLLADALFKTQDDQWLRPSSLPVEPLRCLGASPLVPGDLAPVPVLYGVGNGRDYALTVTPEWVRCDADLAGSAFALLTRYEEIARPASDHRDRYPASASIAFRAGFLERPVVNEYLEILWAALSHLWPDLLRRPRTPRLMLSHDVDWPIVTLHRSPAQLVRAVGGDVLRRRDGQLALRRVAAWPRVRQGNWRVDPGYVFQFMLGVSARNGLRTAYNFIAGHSAGEIDGVYQLTDPGITTLLRDVAAAGHVIGLHPSYNSYDDLATLTREFDTLRETCVGLGIEQTSWTGRQHYLRWRNPVTWRNWAISGLSIDGTLGFADAPGFRAGTCYEYPVFDLLERKSLPLREQPLIAMDATLLGNPDEPGVHATLPEAVEKIAGLQATTLRYNGDFSLLWHNTWLVQRSQRVAYSRCIDQLTEALAGARARGSAG